ncbi:hypothetical protein HYV49_05855 [Candidatus Pacearchaeota archaeon]|nr:hypothetical protein [Candidatus Pacearchaeota archaeon]
MSVQLDLDNLADEILGYVKEEKVMTELNILYRYALTHDNIPSTGLSMQVCDTLKDLVN